MGKSGKRNSKPFQHPIMEDEEPTSNNAPLSVKSTEYKAYLNIASSPPPVPSMRVEQKRQLDDYCKFAEANQTSASNMSSTLRAQGAEAWNKLEPDTKTLLTNYLKEEFVPLWANVNAANSSAANLEGQVKVDNDTEKEEQEMHEDQREEQQITQPKEKEEFKQKMTINQQQEEKEDHRETTKDGEEEDRPDESEEEEEEDDCCKATAETRLRIAEGIKLFNDSAIIAYAAQGSSGTANNSVGTWNRSLRSDAMGLLGLAAHRFISDSVELPRESACSSGSILAGSSPATEMQFDAFWREIVRPEKKRLGEINWLKLYQLKEELVYEKVLFGNHSNFRAKRRTKTNNGTWNNIPGGIPPGNGKKQRIFENLSKAMTDYINM